MVIGYKRLVFIDFGDRYFKKVRGELINYDYYEGIVKILYVFNDLVYFLKIFFLIYYCVKFNSGL